jgi:uncharacterized iron-regulated membrane protein
MVRDWLALGLVPLAAIYLVASGVYLWRARRRMPYDPWKHSRPRRQGRRRR